MTPTCARSTADRFAPGPLRRLAAPLARTLFTAYLRPGQTMRASQFDRLGVPPGHVALLGDSLTEFGLWQEWFAGLPVLNRGIGGETSSDLLRRLHSALLEPQGVCLLIGTNDLTMGTPLSSIEQNVRAILDEIELLAPGVPVVVQSVPPRTARFRDDIELLNRRYRHLVDQAGDHVTYLDLWPALADRHGNLTDAYTGDGLHLTGGGYAAWAGVLRPVIERMLASP